MRVHPPLTKHEGDGKKAKDPAACACWAQAGPEAHVGGPSRSESLGAVAARLPDLMCGPFVTEADSPEDARQKKFLVTLTVVGVALSALLAIARHWVLAHRYSEAKSKIADGMTLQTGLVGLYFLLHLYRWGLTPLLKAFFIVNSFIWVTFAAIVSPYMCIEFWYVMVLDLCLVLQSDLDRVLMDRLSLVLRVGIVVYLFLHILSESEVMPTIHPFEPEFSAVSKFFCSAAPILLNFNMMRSYAVSAKQEALSVNNCAEVASSIAHSLANFDLDGAEALLKNCDQCQGTASTLQTPLMQILRNLRCYRPFLPSALFWQAEAQVEEPPNQVIADTMSGEHTSWEHARAAVQRLRDPDYSLGDFRLDVQAAFPELKLYSAARAVGPAGMTDTRASFCSSGRTGSEELERTMGAMYSVYCLARLDMDGREIFSYGVDSSWLPRMQPVGEAADRRREFYEHMQWDQMVDLVVRADLLVRDSHRNLGLNTYRMTAFLVLTAVHDVMKNTSLLPTVQKKHAPYGGISEGSSISDHDLALAYVMEHFPGLLPSYRGLEPGQRAPVLFSQGRMGFNNGWLVQGEAPPGALFSTFKRVITHSRACEADISFYFAHWITDLAGSELFGVEPWPGSEKFVLKFPLKVLTAFLDSFTFLDNLASRSEVEVMEEYLASRWLALGPPAVPVEEACKVASMRLALMAQGFEAEVVAALHRLPRRQRDIIGTEMARTGCLQQFASAPAHIQSWPGGPALLVYYAPALIQKAGAAQALEALQMLAAVYSAARKLFPLKGGPSVEQTVVVRIDQLKMLTPEQIRIAKQWHLKRTSASEAEAVMGLAPLEAADGSSGGTDVTPLLVELRS